MLLNFGNYRRPDPVTFGGFDPGWQPYHPGQGGPQSHMGLRAMAPVSWPIIYAVGTPGLGAMPRQVLGPTLPILNNAFSHPRSIQNLEIAGLFKPPFGNQLS